MIYLDTSVALAQLLSEDRVPPDGLWKETLVSSRLLEYEIWNRIHARRLDKSQSELVREFVRRIALIELARPVLARALEAFPTPVRALAALHLASLEFLREQGQTVSLASYDERMLDCAKALAVPVYSL